EKEVNPAAKRALARLADLAAEDELWLEQAARVRGRGLIRDSEIAVRPLSRVPAAIRRRILRAWLRAVRGDLRAIDLEHVDRLVEHAASPREGRSIDLPGGSVAVRSGRLVWNVAPKEAPPAARTLSIGGEVEFGEWRLRASTSGKRMKSAPDRAI